MFFLFQNTEKVEHILFKGTLLCYALATFHRLIKESIMREGAGGLGTEIQFKELGEGDKKVKSCFLPQKVCPIFQCRSCSSEAKRWHITVACTYGIFIHVHKQLLFSWVDQWVSDEWYLSSFIHWLRIHGVCWIGKNKSIFKQLKNIGQGSLCKPAIIPLPCILCCLG